MRTRLAGLAVVCMLVAPAAAHAAISFDQFWGWLQQLDGYNPMAGNSWFGTDERAQFATRVIDGVTWHYTSIFGADVDGSFGVLNGTFSNDAGEYLSMTACMNGGGVQRVHRICTSAPNACGMTGTGFIDEIYSDNTTNGAHSGSGTTVVTPCSAVKPADSLCGSGVPVSPGGTGGGSPSSSCTPAYTCSGTSITYRSSSCAITTVTTCAAPSFCQSGASQCANPSMTFGTFSGTYDATDAAGHTTHTTLSLDGHLRAYPALVKKGNTARLYWSVTNAASCTITSPNGFSSTLKSSGTTGIETPAITQQTVFTLHCTGLPRTTPAAIDETATVSIIPVFEEQ